MPKPHPPTIYDVAESAGVSITTVSRVLNSPEQVNQATRLHVQAAIDALGFVPKAEARARALRSSGRVGVITPYFTSPSFVQRLRGVSSVLTAANYELVIYTVDTLERLNSYLETLPLRHNLDGLILISVCIDETTKQRLIQHHLETVLIEFPIQEFNSVAVDDIEGGRMAARAFAAKGHKRMAFVNEKDLPRFGFNPITSRLVGFREALDEMDFPFSDNQIWPTAHDVEATRIYAFEQLQKPNRPTAIFASTDLRAIGVLKAARQLGLRVPEDLAIIGFDDLDIADYLSLSTIRQPLDESGRIAAELLFSQRRDPSRPVQHILLPLTIVERETT